MRDIGKNIKQLRQIKNMTQDELAEKLFVTRQTVSNYEIGRTRPDIEMLTKMAEVMGTDVNEILYGIPEPVNKKKEIIKSCVAFIASVILFTVIIFLQEKAKQIASSEYDLTWALWVQIVAYPVFWFVAGWTLLQILGTFTKLVPLANSMNKRISVAILACTGIYCTTMIPILLAGGVPEWMPTAWLQAALLFMGALHGYNQLPWCLLFAFLFGGLCWLFPWRIKK